MTHQSVQIFLEIESISKCILYEECPEGFSIPKIGDIIYIKNVDNFYPNNTELGLDKLSQKFVVKDTCQFFSINSTEYGRPVYYNIEITVTLPKE